MNGLQKGLLVGGLQLALVASIGAKLEWDRARLPRAWAPVTVYDPDLVIRGRYLSFTLQVKADRMTTGADGRRTNIYTSGYGNVQLVAENGRVTAVPMPELTGVYVNNVTDGPDGKVGVLTTPVLYFISEHAQLPARRNPGEQWWIEVTLPKKGPPRPIRMAIKTGEAFIPLDL